MGIVAIVGRPNVGKSTLFNRLVGKRQAIVDQTAGVTRDRHYGKTDWNGREFSIVDTGGYAHNTDDVFEEQIRRQVLIAIQESDVVVFMVDVQTGITDYDQSIAGILRKSEKPVIVAVNKVDHGGRIFDTYEFHALGLGEPISIAAASGSGTGELLDRILEELHDDSTVEEEHVIPHIAIVGRPNVGKSSLTNAFLGEERNIVTPVAGTTRDAITVRYNKFGYDFMLVDTAGLRKKTKTREDLEFYSSMRAVRAIEYSDVCILMLDATLGVESQDMNIF
ncbi:MAG TPA: ribosome biogenesis GTPase Der, partial [Rikenellaceae bacterium]|nr:ribosome biogenesis GTPase Der [Rikenellaceae bacterium]